MNDSQNKKVKREGVKPNLLTFNFTLTILVTYRVIPFI